MLEAGDVRSQPLLIPQTVNLSQKLVDTLLEGSHLYTPLGFEIERLGEETVVLRRIPAMLHGLEAASLLDELVTQLQRTGNDVEEKSGVLQEALVSRAVSANPVTELAEAQRVLQQVEGLPDQGREFCCPLTLEQLQQWFSRNGRG
jgi:DNA mismatch repair protein MutL